MAIWGGCIIFHSSTRSSLTTVVSVICGLLIVKPNAIATLQCKHAPRTGFICTLLHAVDGGVLAPLANKPQSFVYRNIGLMASRRFAKSIALQCHNRAGIVFQPVAQAFKWVTIDVR